MVSYQSIWHSLRETPAIASAVIRQAPRYSRSRLQVPVERIEVHCRRQAAPAEGLPSSLLMARWRCRPTSLSRRSITSSDLRSIGVIAASKFRRHTASSGQTGVETPEEPVIRSMLTPRCRGGQAVDISRS